MREKIIGFIPARGGSKSIPLKNIKPFCGKPLIYWTLRALNESHEVGEVHLATDHDEIDRCAISFNFSKLNVYRRDEANAADKSSTESVMLEFLNRHSFNDDDIFVLVQATTPFLTTHDISNALKVYMESGADSMLSCARIKRFLWNDDGTPLNYDFRARPRRQDFGGLLMENGAFYINRVGNIRADANRLSGRIVPYEMEEFTSFEMDEPEDWLIGEELMRRYMHHDIHVITPVKLVLTDIDGVLTDAGMYYSERGDELKKFNTLDGKGFELLRNRGIKTGIVTSENTTLVKWRSEKIRATFLYQGVTDKLQVVTELCRKEGIELREVAYIGDDLNDIELLRNVGIAACPSSAVDEIGDLPGILHLKKKGGEGVFREFVSHLIRVKAV